MLIDNAVLLLLYIKLRYIKKYYIYPKTFKTERGCPFLIKINKKESTYNN